MRIKVAEWINIAKVRSNKHQKCSYCKEPMKEGTHALSIRKRMPSGQGFNVWIHLRCIEDFLETVEEGFNENKEELLVEAI